MVPTNFKTRKIDRGRAWFDTRFFTLVEALFQADTVQDTADFIGGLLSDYERRAILQRWHIILYLYKTDLSYEKIAKKVGCSSRTVTTIASWYKSSEPIRLALEKISPNQLTEDELDDKLTLASRKAFLRRLKGGVFWAGLLGEYKRTNRHPYIEELIES